MVELLNIEYRVNLAFLKAPWIPTQGAYQYSHHAALDPQLYLIHQRYMQKPSAFAFNTHSFLHLIHILFCIFNDSRVTSLYLLLTTCSKLTYNRFL